jgi:predicted amidohydrolase YtcJ
MRNVLHQLLLTALILAPMGAMGQQASTSEDAADLIFRQGVFYPVEPAEPVEGSLAVKDGRIVYLGSDAGAEALRGPETEVVDLAGKTVTPGLIDAHSHLAGLGQALETVDLGGADTYQEVVDRLAAAARELPAGTWVQGRGWDQNRWPDQQFPHHETLSSALPEHPVWATRVDGHAVLVNALAMERLGIDSEAQDPSGGRFLRDAEGEPTGVLIDNAIRSVADQLPEPSAADLERRISRAAEHCLARGLTTVTDMGIGTPVYEAYRSLREKDELALRTALFLTDDARLLREWFERGPEIDPQARLQVRGIKLYADGALGSRGAALVEPYTDDPGNLGLLTTTGDAVEATAKRALETGFQVGIHTIGDRGALVALDALERAFGGEPRRAARFRLEHAQVMRLADIERMADLGIIASMQPTHATSDMPWAEARVGARRILGAYAWQRMRAAGVPLALGSDFPVESADPRLGLYAAVTRQDLDGDPSDGWYANQRLTRPQALAGFTLDAAHSLFLEDEVGSLSVGKRADLVVFERDIMTVPEQEIPDVEIAMTVVDGRIVYRREGS